MARKIQDKLELIGEPLADGEYTSAPNSFASAWHMTPEQREWVKKYNEAIGVFNTTGDRTLAEELGIQLPEREA